MPQIARLGGVSYPTLAVKLARRQLNIAPWRVDGVGSIYGWQHNFVFLFRLSTHASALRISSTRPKLGRVRQIVEIALDAIALRISNGMCNNGVQGGHSVDSWWQHCVADINDQEQGNNRVNDGKSRKVRRKLNTGDCRCRTNPPQKAAKTHEKGFLVYATEGARFNKHFGVPKGADGAYAMMRDPHDYVLSMYFQCKRNADKHVAKGSMSTFPDLSTWLSSHVKYEEEQSKKFQEQSKTKSTAKRRISSATTQTTCKDTASIPTTKRI
jgi:hypothetical protein